MGFHFDRKVANFLVMKVGVFFSALATAEKILCLHGGGGNANSMRSLMSEIAADLSEFEFVYATAPEGGLWMRDPPSGVKKDQMYLTVEGLDTVDFGNKVVDDCLQAVQCGTMAYGNRQDNMAACAAYDKDLGW